MMSRPIACALLAACALACTNQDSPTSVVDSVAERAMTDPGAQVHSIVVMTQESDYTLDGTVDETYVITTSLDQHGNAVLVDEEANRGGSIRRKVTSSTFDRWGNALEQTIDLDWPVNGPRDSRYWITTKETDQWGRPSRRVYLLDYDNDGSPDHESNTLYYPEYDRRGKPLLEIEDSDHDGDGTLESRETQTMAYDRHGNVELWTSESDWLMDGTIDEWFRTKSTYNDFCAVVEDVSEWDFQDGLSRSWTTTSQFDDDGNPVAQVSESDFAPVDGVADSRTVVTTSFDPLHRPLSQVRDYDRDANGTVDSRVTRRYEYFGGMTKQSGPSILAIPSVWQSGALEPARAP